RRRAGDAKRNVALTVIEDPRSGWFGVSPCARMVDADEEVTRGLLRRTQYLGYAGDETDASLELCGALKQFKLGMFEKIGADDRHQLVIELERGLGVFEALVLKHLGPFDQVRELGVLARQVVGTRIAVLDLVEPPGRGHDIAAPHVRGIPGGRLLTDGRGIGVFERARLTFNDGDVEMLAL